MQSVLQPQRSHILVAISCILNPRFMQTPRHRPQHASHHPETDGKTKRANRTIEAMLTACIAPH